MMKRTLALGIGFGTASVLAGFLVYSHTAANSATAAKTTHVATASDPRIEDLQAELKGLRRQLVHVQNLQLSATRQSPHAGEDAEKAAAEPTPKPAQAPPDTDQMKAILAEEASRREARFAAFSERLRTEARDATWSREAERSVGRAISDIRGAGANGMSLEQMDCSTSLCRVTVVYASAAERESAAQQFRPEGFSKGTVHLFDEGGQFKSITYMARTGHPLDTPH